MFRNTTLWVRSINRVVNDVFREGLSFEENGGASTTDRSEYDEKHLLWLLVIPVAIVVAAAIFFAWRKQEAWSWSSFTDLSPRDEFRSVDMQRL